jgi:putative effector of murein hydrolase LrgA (UPF0299 family)
MTRTILSIVIILHGLVHIWYLLLLSKVIKYTPEMGWTGNSWLVSGASEIFWIRYSGIILYSLICLLFVSSGIGLMSNSSITRNLLNITVILSSILIIFFFDGRFDMLVQKGFVGLIINTIIIFLVYTFPDKII